MNLIINNILHQKTYFGLKSNEKTIQKLFNNSSHD
jgi:hypothetical protein